MNTIKVNELLDFTLTQDGEVALSTGHKALSTLINLDIELNSNWFLDNRLGLDWVNSYGTGLLQKRGEADVVAMVIKNRILGYEGVKSVDNIIISSDINRNGSFKADVVFNSGEKYTFEG